MFNIAIDGVGGSGKSTLSKGLAKRIGFNVLDTGALYRGIACAYRAGGYGEVCEDKLARLIDGIKMEIYFEGDLQHVIVNGVDYTDELRSEEISNLTSRLSGFQMVRNVVLSLQRKFAKENNCVVEGRDVGSEVLPNADVKFFITASAKVRAQRRYAQVKDKPNAPSFEEVLNDLNRRDYSDTHREHGAIVQTEDAILIDTTNLTLEESISKCENIIKEKLGLKF